MKENFTRPGNLTEDRKLKGTKVTKKVRKRFLKHGSADLQTSWCFNWIASTTTIRTRNLLRIIPNSSLTRSFTLTCSWTKIGIGHRSISKSLNKWSRTLNYWKIRLKSIKRLVVLIKNLVKSSKYFRPVKIILMPVRSHLCQMSWTNQCKYKISSSSSLILNNFHKVNLVYLSSKLRLLNMYWKDSKIRLTIKSTFSKIKSNI